MTYVIIMTTDWGLEYRHDIKGTPSLEKYTDNRIIAIYGNKAKHVYKVYNDSRCVILK